MTILQRLHDSEIEAMIKTSQYDHRPFYWEVWSPFGTADKTAFGQEPTLADAEAELAKYALMLFPESNFAQAEQPA